MPKSAGNIRFKRLDRCFIGTHTPERPASEHWYESGHFTAGVDMTARRLFQKNGLLRFDNENLGFVMEGTFELPQNTITDFDFYHSVLNGIRNAAFLIGNHLWLFRLVPLGAGKYQDNRISFNISDSYNFTPGEKAKGEISGYVRAYERFTVKDVELTSARQLRYKILEGNGSIALLTKADSNNAA